MDKVKVDKGTGLSREDCIKLGTQVLSNFTSTELKDYSERIFKLAESYTDVRGQAAIDRAMKEINDQEANFLLSECKTIANNVEKVAELKTIVSDRKNMREVLTPRGRSQATNIAESQAAARGNLFRPFENLSKEEQTFISDKKNSMDIYKALDGDEASPMAKKIAKIIQEEYEPLRDSELLRTDAMSIRDVNEYKYLDHTHNASLMINGGKNFVKRAMDLIKGNKDSIGDPKLAWREFIKPLLDLPAMFSEKKLPDADKVLDKIYDNITTNDNQPFTSSISVNYRELIQNKSRMRLLFKDWKSFGEYNDKFGHGDFFSSLMADLRGSGNKIGMADLFGSTPKSTYMDIKKTQQEVGLSKDKKPSSLWFRNTDLIFNQLLKVDQTVVSPGLADFMSNIRSLTAVNRLLRLAILSIPDVAHGVAYLGRFQHDQVKGLGYFLTNVLNNPLGKMLYPERAQVAKNFRLICHSDLGYLSRFSDAATPGQMINRFVNTVFKGIGVEGMDNGNKISSMHLMSKILGDASNQSWNDLKPALRKQLENHNLTEQEWELLRSKTKNKLFTTDNVYDLSDDDLKELPSTRSLMNRRADLHRKVYSFFDVASQNTVLNPDAFSEAFVYQGTTPGTSLGEAMRMFMQFKMYPVTYMDRVWNQGLRNAEGMMPKIAFATRLMAMTVPLSYMSLYFDNLAMGKSMPDPDNMTTLEKEQYFISLAMPGAGIFLQLLNARNQNNKLLTGTLGTPSAYLISDVLSAFGALIGGDTDRFQKQLKNAGKAIIPVDTTPLISPLLRDAMGETPYLQPGQEQLYGA